jgi:hypothetical protein
MRIRIQIRDPESFKPWIRDVKNRNGIWDKNPGSATLLSLKIPFCVHGISDQGWAFIVPCSTSVL